MSNTASFFTEFQASDILFLGEAAGRTLLISAISISIGTVLGVFFGWALQASKWGAQATIGTVLDIFRSVPLLIQLILFYNF